MAFRLDGQELCGAFRWLGVQITACDGDAGMGKGGAHNMDRCATIHCVTGVSVTEPVRRYLASDLALRAAFWTIRRLHRLFPVPLLVTVFSTARRADGIEWLLKSA